MIGSIPYFVKEFMPTEGSGLRILEVGALDVDGSGSLKQFAPPEAEYITTDMRGGSNVDVVVNAHDLVEKFGKESFDYILCFETFEHDDAFWVSWQNILDVLKSGGYVLLSMPGRNCPYHSHPRDYWRFTIDAFEDYFFKGMEDVTIRFQPNYSSDTIHVGDDWVMGRAKKP